MQGLNAFHHLPPFQDRVLGNEPHFIRVKSAQHTAPSGSRSWSSGRSRLRCSLTPFVYAYNYHPQNTDNPRKFEDCLEARLPSYVHAYQALCITRRSADIPFQRFRVPSANAKYLNLPNNRTTTQKKVTILRDGRCSPMEGPIPLMVKPQLYVMLGPVVTTEAHLAHAGSGLHPNNTAELSSIIGALSFLELAGSVARGSQACFFL